MLSKKTIFGISVAQEGCKAYTVHQDKISFSVTCRILSRPVDLTDTKYHVRNQKKKTIIYTLFEDLQEAIIGIAYPFTKESEISENDGVEG